MIDRRLAFVGLGANLGEPALTLQQAFAALHELPDTALVSRSSLYRSQPLDAGGPPFVNAVAALETRLPAEALLEELLAIEHRFGRQRPYLHAPRTLDLDLLLYGDAVCRTPALTLPHPRLHLRAFVLVPLLEIAPTIAAPGLGPLSPFLPALAGQAIERLA